MLSTIINGISGITGKVTGAINKKNELKAKAQEASLGYLKAKMTTTIFGIVAIISVLPYFFYMTAPFLKYIPFMTDVLIDYEKIINYVGFDKIYNIVVGLLGLGGIASVGSIAGKVSMAKRKNDNDAAIEKEKIKKGIIGDDFVNIETESKLKKVQEFIKNFADAAENVEKEYGLPANGVLAHAALETGWGKSILKGYRVPDGKKIETNNIFNIKKSSTWSGPVAARKVWEMKDGDNVMENHLFKVYKNYNEAFADYAKLLTTLDRYKKVTQAKNVEEFGKALYECGYMTDSDAPGKILKIAEKYFIYET